MRSIRTDSTTATYQSIPASNSLFLNANYKPQNADHISFPVYDDTGYRYSEESVPLPSLQLDDFYTVSTASNSTSTDASQPELLNIAKHSKDDTAMQTQPSRHVDYLLHIWKEEDSLSSWKHIVSKGNAYANRTLSMTPRFQYSAVVNYIVLAGTNKTLL